MVQITKAFLVAAIVASPALSIPVQNNEQELVSRDPGLFGGILNVGKKILGFRRELDDSLDVRELIDELESRGEELDARDPGLFGGILNVGKKILGFRRELDDSLDARELTDELESRDLSGEELDVRDPGLFGGILNVGKKILGFRREIDEEVFARELYEELAARGVFPELETREMSSEDLIAREPSIFGKIFKTVFSRRDVDEDIVARELYEELAARGAVPELDTREMSSEDLVARDPGIFGKIFGAVKGALFRRDINGASFDELD